MNIFKLLTVNLLYIVFIYDIYIQKIIINIKNDDDYIKRIF